MIHITLDELTKSPIGEVNNNPNKISDIVKINYVDECFCD